MPIEFECPVCGKVLRVPESTWGEQTRCPKCQAIQTIPELAAVMVGGAMPRVEDLPPSGEGENLFAEREVPEETLQVVAEPPSLAALQAVARQRLKVPIRVGRVILWLFFGASALGLAGMSAALVAGAAKVEDVAVLIVLFSVLAMFQGLALWGHSQALRLESYFLAWAGLVLAPLGTMFCFTLPFVVWGGVVLLDEPVYRAFRS